MLFSSPAPAVDDVVLKEIEQEAGLAYANTLVNEEKLSQALTIYSSIPTPQSAFNAAQVRSSQVSALF